MTLFSCQTFNILTQGVCNDHDCITNINKHTVIMPAHLTPDIRTEQDWVGLVIMGCCIEITVMMVIVGCSANSPCTNQGYILYWLQNNK